jgi:simple sugar transport system permease protein
MAINLLASGTTLYLFRTYAGGGQAPTFQGMQNVVLPWLSTLPAVGQVLFSQRALTYLAFALVPLVWWGLYKTRQGLELRALGENPKALETKGLRVTPRLYAATIIGSALTGLGGAFLLLGMSDRFTADISGGRGWLVVVALVAGNWSVPGTFLAVIVFAVLEAIASHAQVLALPVPYQLFLALPYLASILLLTLVRFRSGMPARLGVPYERA